MWEVIWQILLAILGVSVTGYAAHKIVKTLAPRFVSLWQGLINGFKRVYGKANSATELFVAQMLETTQKNWQAVRSSIIAVVGMVATCSILLYAEHIEGLGLIASLVARNTNNGRSKVFNTRVASQKGIQLPTRQNPVTHSLIL